MARNLKNATVVITGASSGIGRASALRFASEGANVIGVARRREALESLVAEIEAQGGSALAMPADVRDEAALKDVADTAVATFGTLDVWVSNAGVTALAPFEATPPDVYRQVFETNYFGTVHSARAALPHFRRQNSGVLINNASLLAEVGGPYLAAYASSKFAIRGLGDSLRGDLRRTKIEVCTLMPGSIDTPIFQHAANYSGRTVKALNPVVDVDRVAKAIVSLAKRPRRERVVGNAARFQVTQHRLAPGPVERMMAVQVEHDHFKDEPSGATSGAVLEPMPEFTGTRGGWKKEAAPGRLGARRIALAALGLGAGAALGRAARGARRGSRNGDTELLTREVAVVEGELAPGSVPPPQPPLA